MLARKGYGGGLAAAVVREALDRSPLPDTAEGTDDFEVDEDALLP
jgi:regulatory protein